MVGWVVWHGGDGQKSGVSHTLKSLYPAHTDDNAWWGEKHITPASVPAWIELGSSPLSQIDLPQHATPAKSQTYIHGGS